MKPQHSFHKIRTLIVALILFISVIGSSRSSSAQQDISNSESQKKLEHLQKLRSKLSQQKQHKQACETAEQVIALTKEIYGEESRQYAYALSSLGHAYENCGRWREVSGLYEQELAIFAKLAGNDKCRLISKIMISLDKQYQSSNSWNSNQSRLCHPGIASD